MGGRLVNQTELSEILDVSKTAITKWDKDHGMPVAVRGKRGQTHSYDIGAILRWYGDWQVSKVLAHGAERAGKVINLKQEEARLKLHQADKAEVEAQLAQGKALIFEEVKDTLNEIAVQFGSQLDALGGRLANELAAIEDPAEIRQKLFAEGRRIRGATADALTALAADADTRGLEVSTSTGTEDG